jgi:hypothetical protein
MNAVKGARSKQSSTSMCVEVKGQVDKDTAGNGKRTPLLKLCLKLALTPERSRARMV